MKKLFNYLWNTNTGNVLLMGKLFLLFGIVLQISSYKIISGISSRVVTEINQADSIGDNSVSHLSYKNARPQMQYIKEQFLLAGKLKTVYKEMTLEYFRNYYAFSVCFTIFATMLTIASFLVAHQGWSHSPVKLKAFMSFTALFASFYYFTPKVMNNGGNIAKAIQQQRAYEGIQLDILAFGTTADTANTRQMDSMITVTARAIKVNYSFAITIDPSQVGMSPTDILTGGSTGSGNNSPDAGPAHENWNKDNKHINKPTKP